MSSTFDDEPHPCFLSEEYGTLDVLNVSSRDDESRITVDIAWIAAGWQTSNIVVVSRYEVECMERCVRPLSCNETTRSVIVFDH